MTVITGQNTFCQKTIHAKNVYNNNQLQHKNLTIIKQAMGVGIKAINFNAYLSQQTSKHKSIIKAYISKHRVNFNEILHDYMVISSNAITVSVLLFSCM